MGQSALIALRHAREHLVRARAELLVPPFDPDLPLAIEGIIWTLERVLEQAVKEATEVLSQEGT